jgi:folate-dependent phosphoribosylglycinamide formyltransferase PurN
MKIMIFTPDEHFYAPIILREIGLKNSSDEIMVLATPKLGKKGFISGLAHLVKQSGIDYLVSMAVTKLTFIFLGMVEKIMMRPFPERKFISLKDVVKNTNLKETMFNNINGSKTIAFIKDYSPDIILVLFFNQIVGKCIMEIPRYGIINMHPSYLPSYRGISPCFWALANNELSTGVTAHYLVPGIDSGSVIWQGEISISLKDTFFSLYRRCAEKGAGNVFKVLEKVKAGENGFAQDETSATYFSDITPKSVRRFRRNRRKFGWFM